MNNVSDLWKSILEKLKNELSETTIATWFDELDIVDFKGNALYALTDVQTNRSLKVTAGELRKGIELYLGELQWKFFIVEPFEKGRKCKSRDSYRAHISKAKARVKQKKYMTVSLLSMATYIT